MKPILKTAPKFKSIFIGFLATAIILPTTTFAFQDKAKVKQDRFTQIDTNGDGTVDFAEFMTHAEMRAEKRGTKVKRGGHGRHGVRVMRGNRGAHKKPIDINGDGSISLEEFSKPTLDALTKMANKRLKSRFEDLDRNEDGKLSKAEQERPMRKRFERMDENEDGKLSKQEIAQSRRAMHKNKTSGGKKKWHKSQSER